MERVIDLSKDMDSLDAVPAEVLAKVTAGTLVVPPGEGGEEYGHLCHFEKIGDKLPNLASLYIEGPKTKEEVKLSLSALARVLSKCRDTVEEIYSENITWNLPEASDEVNGCGNMLINAKSLRSIQFSGKDIPSVLKSQMVPLMLKVFNGNETLQDASIVSHRRWRSHCMFRRLFVKRQVPGVKVDLLRVPFKKNLAQELFARTANLKNLQICFGDGVTISDEAALLEGINDANKLTKLSLCGSIHASYGIRVFQHVFLNPGMPATLRSFELTAFVYSQSDIEQFIEALRNTTSPIKNLDLRMDFSGGISPIEMLEPIGKNGTLERVCLTASFLHSGRFGADQNSICERVKVFPTRKSAIEQVKEFEGMLEQSNTSLREIKLHQVRKSNPIPIFSKEAEFWLKCNAAGRRELLRSPENTRLWVNTLIKQRSDHRIVFYLLSLKPSLLVPSHWRPCAGSQTKRAKKRKRSS